MKEALAKTLSGLSHLTPHDCTQPAIERPVDRLGAIAMASRVIGKTGNAQRQANLAALGKRLYSLKYANREDEYPAAHADLAGMIRFKVKGISHTEALNLSRLCIREWVIDVCVPCSGKGQVADHDIKHLEGPQPMRQCHSCAGTGHWKYSDAERATFMELPIGVARGLFPAIERGHSLISECVSECLKSTRQMLERWT